MDVCLLEDNAATALQVRDCLCGRRDSCVCNILSPNPFAVLVHLEGLSCSTTGQRYRWPVGKVL